MINWFFFPICFGAFALVISVSLAKLIFCEFIAFCGIIVFVSIVYFVVVFSISIVASIVRFAVVLMLSLLLFQFVSVGQASLLGNLDQICV